jgi:DNA-binding response OmpR family regulator
VAIAKILIIDDDPDMRQMMGRALAHAHHEVIESADGVDGLRKFRTENPTIVITDIVMPHRDGLEMIREIREMGSNTGVIAVSGGGIGSGELYLSISEDFGADAVLQKPFRPADLIATVEKLLDRREPPA